MSEPGPVGLVKKPISGMIKQKTVSREAAHVRHAQFEEEDVPDSVWPGRTGKTLSSNAPVGGFLFNHHKLFFCFALLQTSCPIIFSPDNATVTIRLKAGKD
ncbi:MAG: hypothetical protein C0613_05265 [Desulfobulbaceae bacterium]|nr:MAG: hypothetical protein C0613_05265 [Desulfobulbaceae bacterium]